MDISIETLQAFLDDAWDAAPENANSLRAQFRVYESALTRQFATGGTIGSVAKNSASQSYRGPGLGQYTAAQLQTAWRSLINLFDRLTSTADCLQEQAVAWFVQKFPDYANDKDGAIFFLMSGWLADDFSEYQIDLTDLRLRPTLQSGVALTW